MSSLIPSVSLGRTPVVNTKRNTSANVCALARSSQDSTISITRFASGGSMYFLQYRHVFSVCCYARVIFRFFNFLSSIGSCVELMLPVSSVQLKIMLKYAIIPLMLEMDALLRISCIIFTE